MGEAIRSEPLNNCHWDEVTPIASSHSALIFSSCCSAVPITFTFTAVPASTFTAVSGTFTFTVHSSSGMSSSHSALQMYCSDKANTLNLQPREIQYSQCNSFCAAASTFTLLDNLHNYNFYNDITAWDFRHFHNCHLIPFSI